MKRWQLPTQKGVELFPRATVSPPKLIIQGVETGTPLYRAVAARFGSELKRFHGKAQQTYALSTVDVMKLRQTIPGARMSYANIQGQEIISLEVDHSVFAELYDRTKDWWEWALIYFVVPNIEQAMFAAFMKAPLLQPLTPELTFAKGVSVDYGGAGQGDKPMSFPDTSNTQFMRLPNVTMVGNYTMASLLVDLTVQDAASQVVIDVYGNLPPEYDLLCGRQNSYLPVVVNIAFPPQNPVPTGLVPVTLDSVFWELYGSFSFRATNCEIETVWFRLGSGTNNFGSGTLPARLSQTWDYEDSTGETHTITISAVRSGSSLTVTISTTASDLGVYGSWTTAGPTSNPLDSDGWWTFTVSGETNTNGWVTGAHNGSANIRYTSPARSGETLDYRETWSVANVPGGTTFDEQTNYTAQFIPYLENNTGDDSADLVLHNTRNLTVRGFSGKRGPPEWNFAERTSSISTFNTWERSETYPELIDTVVVRDDLQISSEGYSPGGSLFNHFGMTFLGTLIIDRVHGGISWQDP